MHTSQTETAGHEPVLLNEVLDGLRVDRRGRYLDATFGGGGHARAILSANEQNHLLALDRDPRAAERSEQFARDFPGRFAFQQLNFAELDRLEKEYFDGALFDLGVSSFQLDEGQRGFSFQSDAPLDMRMDPDNGPSAADFLETADEADLIRAVRDYGEEKRWRGVVRAIMDNRRSGRLRRTASFAELVAERVRQGGRPTRIHPATRTFQGVRIAVNGELDAVTRALPAAFARLEPGGRLAVISFHSLEDRIVKRFFRARAGRPEHGRDSRSQEERTVEATLPFTKPVRPGEAEIRTNPRSRSARLRILIKLGSR